jgi:membrane protease YdiL (CAAX protease family)
MSIAIHPDGLAATPLSHRILRFPLTRIVLALVFFMVPFLLIQAGSGHFFENKLFTRMGQLLGVGVGCLSYAFYAIKIEKRAVSELALHGALREYGVGFMLGGLMVCISVAGIAALGGLRALTVAPASSIAIIALPLMMHIAVGLLEEMMMRGIFFRIVQEYLGSWLALLASGLVFGAMHLVNDSVSVLGIADTAVAGVFFGAAFLLTGRLWLCAALHAGWNFFQDGVFSLSVSGHKVKEGLLVTALGGPDWLTGGAYGIEGSAVDLVFVVLASAAMVVLAWRRGRFVQPVWRRNVR